MRLVIVEDETAAAVNLQAILRKLAPEAAVKAVLESVQEGVDWFGSHPMPDLVFMDIHLADGDSFRIFERIEVTAPVIFTTAYDRYALEAFRVNSIDYLLKPISEADVERALNKLRRLTGFERKDYGDRVRTLAAERRSAVQEQQAFLVHVRDKIIPLKREEIAYCYTRDERVTACDMQGRSYQLDKTLETLQTLLPEADGTVAGKRFFPGQPSVHRLAPGRVRNFGLVRQPPHPVADGLPPRADRHPEGPCSRIQALADGGSPRGLVGSPPKWAVCPEKRLPDSKSGFIFALPN